MGGPFGTERRVHVLCTGPLKVNTLVVPLGGGAAFVVDPAGCPWCGDADVIPAFLRSMGLTPVAAVLTHGHFDHVSGLNALRGQYPGMAVLIHKDDAHYLGSGSQAQRQSLAAIGFSEFYEAVSDLPGATAYLEGGATLADCATDATSAIRDALGQWQVRCTPGHTQGSVCLHNGAQGLLLSGDTVFFHSCGRTDLPGGNEAQMRQTLSALYRDVPPQTLVYPGHDRTGFALAQNGY